MEPEKTYIAARDLVVDGKKVVGGTPIDDLRKEHGGVWDNDAWLNEALQCGHIIEAPVAIQDDGPLEFVPSDDLSEDELDSTDEGFVDDDDYDLESGDDEEETETNDTDTEDETTTDGDEDELTNETSEINATDAAIRMAEENGLDLSTVTGSGKGGRITQSDVADALEAATNPN